MCCVNENDIYVYVFLAKTGGSSFRQEEESHTNFRQPKAFPSGVHLT